MRIVAIEVAKQSNLAGVLKNIFRTDPDKIIFIGDAPQYVQLAREQMSNRPGSTVEVLPAGAIAPEGSVVLAAAC